MLFFFQAACRFTFGGPRYVEGFGVYTYAHEYSTFLNNHPPIGQLGGDGLGPSWVVGEGMDMLMVAVGGVQKRPKF